VLIREITLRECFEALARASFARLACAKDNQPYVVPVHVAFHEEEGDARLYGFTIPGQKAEWMRANPLVCVEVDEVEGNDRWLSIVVFGRYEELPDTPDCAESRRLAIRLLQGHAMWWEPGATAYELSARRVPIRPLIPIYYQIHIDRVTGHRCTPESRSS
jgi:nitroimidazol reductase NimA-like FMN-containing flavoprotein (pyridoxamine 5'-phosphate oxidase superfamily)